MGVEMQLNEEIVEVRKEYPAVSFYAKHDWDEKQRVCIGNLWVKDNQIFFEGDLNQSAKEFFDYVQYLSSKQKRQENTG